MVSGENMSLVIKCPCCCRTLYIKESNCVESCCNQAHCGCCGSNFNCVIEGIRGAKGDKGEKGDKGDVGAQGVQGERGEQGVQGMQGEQGIQGIQGEIGEKGEQGDPATNFTVSHMSAIHTSGIALDVSVAGVNIPLNGAKILNGFSANESNEEYTVGETGNYFLIYNIKTRDDTTVKTRVVRNGALLSGTVRSSSVPTSIFSVSLIVSLNQGDVISLQLYDLNSSVTLQGGAGASLVLIRLN